MGGSQGVVLPRIGPGSTKCTDLTCALVLTCRRTSRLQCTGTPLPDILVHKDVAEPRQRWSALALS